MKIIIFEDQTLNERFELVLELKLLRVQCEDLFFRDPFADQRFEKLLKLKFTFFQAEFGVFTYFFFKNLPFITVF